MKKLLMASILLLIAIPLVIAETDDQKENDQRRLDVREKAMLQKERIENVREQRLELRERYQEIKQAHADARMKINESRKDLAACRQDTANCTDIRKDLRLHEKEFLLKSAERVLNLLENLKERISNATIDEDRKSSLIEELDTHIAEVTRAEAIIENLDGSSTPEEIKEAAKTIREAWKKAQKFSKFAIGRLSLDKIDHVLARFEAVEEKVTAQSARLKEAGYDTTTLDRLIAEYSAQLDSAETNLEKARELLGKAHTVDDINALVREVNAYIKAAHQDLREAHTLLKDILAEMRSLRSGDQNEEGEA